MGRLTELLLFLKRFFYPVMVFLVFPAIISVSYCFREDVLNKVELYNAADAVDVPYHIEVISVYPADGTADAAVTSVITAQFNDNINMATVNSGTFQVTDGVTPVSGEYSYDAPLKTVKFTPGTIALPVNLSNSQSYSVMITTGVMNIAGESMAADYSWSFTTAAASVPEISLFSPLSEILSGDIYDFGSVDNLGTRPVVMNIWNYGTGNLDIASISSNNVEFVISVNPSPVTLLPGMNTSFTINFTPASTGDKTAQVTIGSTDPDENPFIINLHGVSLAISAPEIQVTSSGLILTTGVSTVDFGTVPVGGTGTVLLVIHNIGSSPLNISGITFGGTNPDLFSTGFTSMTINPGLTGNLSVSFSSAVKINARAELYIHNDDGNENPFIIKLRGRTK